MGRAKKARRKMKVLLRDVRRLQRQQWRDEAKHTCTSCAFVDPMAFIAEACHSPSMEEKLLACLRPGHRPFYCHDGMQLIEGAWIPPRDADGAIDVDHMVPCGGFVTWAMPLYEASVTSQRAAVDKLATTMVRRFLTSPACFPEWRGYTVAQVREALAMVRTQKDSTLL